MLEIVVASVAKDNEKTSVSIIINRYSYFAVGIPSALSFGIMSDVKIFGKTFFDLVDFSVSNVLLPLEY